MNLNEIDEIKESNTAVMTKTKKLNQRKIGVPLIIAACIFLATILFFGVWKCFFDTSIAGTWSFSIEKTTTNSETKKEEKEVVSYDFDFDNNGNFGMHRGGTTLKGRYEFVDYDGTPMLKISISNLGQPYITANFDYDVCGNIFTGRTLRLTDRTGLLLPPDEESSDSKTDEQKAKMKIADSTVIDGYRYYIPEFKSSELTDKVEYYDDFKPDSKLTGSWLYKNGDSGYDYTYTFGDDGTFEMISSEIYTKGSYRIDDGKITVHYFDINGTEYETPLEYSVDGNKMTFGSMEVTKTASKYDYKQEIK
ncbi:MAG: DUF5640 domain-containing protein [Clostridia bacterium]|nr:DUF5640 domain-containing protein [Clostridia bacterium]